ncbi:C39 family peptidase [Actinoallomurus rhizosphaericola]|uniref:C39 family peptidase n=1 Tax=Actinoallomurus rhizosphaericola TaxID=2952536 RepID=UPI0020920EFE|nr:C39 family peptidase [Actinoallomurus rhizosphaericola]MCO5997466.1 C39 family peptidase [Actinoallomurus rhizosphaericola]
MPRGRWSAGLAAATAVVLAGCGAGAAQDRGPADGARALADTPAASAPSASAPAPSASPTVPVPPVSHRLRMTREFQTTSYNCAPASGVMSLSTFHIKVRQSALARKMRTKYPKGTTGDNAMTALRGYLAHTPYSLTFDAWPSSGSTYLLKEVSYDVGVLHRAPLVAVWWERLPWNRGIGSRRKTGHIIVAYGYDQKKRTITVFDPWRPTGGTHTLRASALLKALQPSGLYYIYT